MSRKIFEKCSVVSNVSAGKITLCRGQHVDRKLRVDGTGCRFSFGEKVEVKLFLYGPGQALRAKGGEDFQNFCTGLDSPLGLKEVKTSRISVQAWTGPWG